MVQAMNSASGTPALYVIALDAQDNWWSLVDPTSDGFFYVNLTGAISTSSIT
jgi:hypothetical protein